MAAARPNVFTIPSGISFARAIAAGVIARAGGDPLVLADATILVPTRRAVRTLREAFAEVQGGAALGPRVRALGDLDEDETAFDPSTDDLDRLPAVTPLRRQLLLALLVQRWARIKGQPMPFAQAARQAEGLAGFLDEALSQGVDLTKLKTLAPESLAQHWKEIVGFLDIVSEHWPVLLAAENAIEPVARRDANLRELATRLAAAPPKGPVIAAGSTGSIPATAELLRVIANLPNGALVLPGLDTELDALAWDEIDAGHAQYGLKQLLARIGVEREDVASWSPLPETFAARAARTRFISEALRPPPATDAWRDLVAAQDRALADALDDVALIEAATPREEALAIAIALRETLEVSGRTAALVTPDRSLARRVAAELTRWTIAIDNSAGQRLSRTPPGTFLALLARAAADRFAPVPLLALLKHPLASGGEARGEFLRHVRALERGFLRGLPPPPGLAGIAVQLSREDAPKSLQDWYARLSRILAPLAAAVLANDTNLADLAAAHADTAEKLSATDSESGANRLWRGPAGEAAATLMQDIKTDGAGTVLDDPTHYAELFRDLAEARAVRAAYSRHPRLAILGPLEARLQDFDLVVLGGLNEGGWPAAAPTDPWLSRPLRRELGLEPPERRIGQAAHDFATLAASRSVLMTRSLKDNGAPTVASRWLLRVKQLAKGLGIEATLDARNDLLEWARGLDVRGPEPRARRPKPTPPVTARPRELPITAVETWIRDPYAIYARYVLKLRKLDPLDMEPGPAERGNAMHAALERFLREYPRELPADALAQLLRIGDETFAAVGATGGILALWRPRFERAARWFIEYEKRRRSYIARSHVEVKGSMAIPAPGGTFTLKGRADRIDILTDGFAAILDYKTGRPPSDSQISTLLTPQLPLEAAMLTKGGFGDIRAEHVSALVHVRLTGAEPPGKEFVAKLDADATAAEALAKLTADIARYDSEATPYVSRALPFKRGDVGDYDHLARLREWLLGEAEAEGGEP